MAHDMDGLLRDHGDLHESTPVDLLDAKGGELVPSSPFARDDEAPDVLAAPSVAGDEPADEGVVAAVLTDKPTSAGLAGGRLEFGVGRGIDFQEVMKLGMDFDELRPRFEEGVDVILKAWTQTRCAHRGYRTRRQSDLCRALRRRRALGQWLSVTRSAAWRSHRDVP